MEIRETSEMINLKNIFENFRQFCLTKTGKDIFKNRMTADISNSIICRPFFQYFNSPNIPNELTSEEINKILHLGVDETLGGLMIKAFLDNKLSRWDLQAGNVFPLVRDLAPNLIPYLRNVYDPEKGNKPVDGLIADFREELFLQDLIPPFIQALRDQGHKPNTTFHKDKITIEI